VLSLATTALTLVAAYPVAYALARAPSRAVRSWLLVLTLAPFFTGAIVRTYAWILVLGNTVVTWPVPMLFTERGVLIGLVHFSMPTMILLLAAAISHVDPALERAAASLGATPARVFRRVTLPLSMPGIVSGSLVVFAWTLSAFPTPELLGGGRVKMIANAGSYQQMLQGKVYQMLRLSVDEALGAIPEISANKYRRWVRCTSQGGVAEAVRVP